MGFYATVIYDFVSKYENMPSWAPPVSFYRGGSQKICLVG
jgi:hypothetical protein